jgi:GntR family transcriptional regulator
MPATSTTWRDALHHALSTAGPDEPLYERLKQAIRAQVQGGDVTPHSSLPSYRDLCELTGASRITVMRAISDLCIEGVLYTVPGKGTFVADPHRVYQILPFVGMTDEFAPRARTVANHWLERAIIGASAQLGGLFRTAVGAQVILLSRVRLIDGLPIALQTSYLPAEICPDLLDRPWIDDSLYLTLHQLYGLHLASAQTTVFARIATEEECELLELAHPAPLLCTRQLTFRDDGRPVEWSITSFCADRYELSMTHERSFVPGRRDQDGAG